MSTSGERAAPGRTVVIGLGNDWRGDDRAGLETVRVLREELPAGGAPGVAIVEGGGDLTELIDVWAGADLAVVIDAVRTGRSEEHTSELQSRENLVCRLLLEKKKKNE